MKRPSPSGTVAARSLLRVVDFCRARGHDADTLCRGLGLSIEQLAAPEARVSYELAERLGERALALTCEPSFGLHLAKDVTGTRHVDAGLLLLMASPTVRVALDRMIKHQRYWGDGERARLRPAPSGIAIGYTLQSSSGQFARHADECAMAEIALGLRTLSGPSALARVVRFRHSAPRDLDLHREIFACPIEFDRDRTELELADAVLDAPMKHANDAFFAIFEQEVERALARLPASENTSGGVRAALRLALANGCSLSATARALGVSPRTLQRRLSAEGTSFAELVDAIRRETAIAHLARRTPTGEIAALVGYADVTAFHHAFRRWTGSSPAQFVERSAD